MKLAEIARTFDMSVERFAKYIGYSRQALYQNDVRLTAKAKVAIARLEKLSADMDKIGKEKLQAEHAQRACAIAELKERIRHGGERIDG